MTRLVFRTNHSRALELLFLLLILSAAAISTSGQAISGSYPTQSQPANTWSPGSASTPQVMNPLVVDTVKEASRYTPPNPYVPPTTAQTTWWVNNNPVLWNLPSSAKDQIVRGDPSVLNNPYLPDGRTNPYYQNGGAIPNYYLPSTWTSPIMNWQGVQSNGFMPSTTTYNPSSFGTSYNPSSSYNSNSFTPNPSSYRPPPPQPLSPRPNTVPSQRTVQIQQPRATELQRSIVSPASNIAKAVADAERAQSVHEAAGDKVAQAIGHAELAMLYSQKDKFEQAFQHAATAERMAKTIDDPRLQGDILSRDAAFYTSAGEFDKALADYRQAGQLFRSVNDDKGNAEVFASVGWTFQSLGKTPDAIRCYESALYLFQKIGDKDGAIRVRIGLGSIYQSVGDFGKALGWYTGALSEASKDEQARIEVAIGEIYLSRNEPLKGLHHYETALPLVQFTGQPALEGAILAGMGRSHMALRHYSAPATQNLFERARTSMKDAGNRAGEAGVIASIGELNYWVGISSPTINPKRYFSEALRSYNEALSLMKDVGDRAGEIGVLTNMGLVFDARGKYREALGYYLQALQGMDELQTSARIDEFRINIASQAAGLYQRAILLEVMLKHPAEAFNLSERARARTFLDQLGNRRISAHLPDDFVKREERLRQENISLQRRLGQELSKPGPDVDQDRILSLESQRSKIQRQYSDLITELRVQNPEYASFLNIAPLNLQEVQRQLGPDVTAISYFTTPEETLAFVITKDSLHVSELYVTETQFAWAIMSFLDFSGESGVPLSLKLLYKSLIAPLRHQLKTSRLAIAPYGILHDVPFAALTSDGRRYLSDDYAIFSLPSLSVLPYIRARSKTSANNALVFANNAEQGLSYLGHAYNEARDVASSLQTQPILGNAATTSAFVKSAPEYGIIHLIAHIDHDKHNPQFSRIILGHGKVDDGALEIDQVLGLDLRKTNLVVLSGCQSQAGKWSRGDDIVGLSRAFIYAGSPSVIASLWSVDDEATRTLMVSFYTHLKQGLSKAEALRAAQVDTRQKFPHPYYWAGFVLTGDPGPADVSNVVANSTH
jgi:CHAT domain-containing protein